MKSQVRTLKKKSQVWVDKIIAGHLNRVYITVALNTVIWKFLSYPLDATILLEEDCNNIMRQTIMAALPRLGLNRYFPKTVLFSPLKYQGYGLQHLHTLQTIAHFSSIIDHQLIPSIATNLSQGLLETLYFHLGRSAVVLAITFCQI